MHYRAVRKSTSSCESGGIQASRSHHGNVSIDEDDPEKTAIRACHPPQYNKTRNTTTKPSQPLVDGPARSAGSNQDHGSGEYFQITIPAFSSGISPFSYQRALANRIVDSKLHKHGNYNTHHYTPTFVHDCLMLPGSLASILAKGSAEDIIHRMTPALLPGFHMPAHAHTQQPCLLPSSRPTDFAQGMLLFGEGKRGRKAIHAHYRPEARRAKVRLEIDVLVPVPSDGRHFPTERWRLRRRSIRAHAWLSSNVRHEDVGLRPKLRQWSLEDYLTGNLAPPQTLRVELTAKGDERYENDNDFDSAGESEEKERGVVYGPCGTIDCDRLREFGGWW